MPDYLPHDERERSARKAPRDGDSESDNDTAVADGNSSPVVNQREPRRLAGRFSPASSLGSSDDEAKSDEIVDDVEEQRRWRDDQARRAAALKAQLALAEDALERARATQPTELPRIVAPPRPVFERDDDTFTKKKEVVRALMLDAAARDEKLYQSDAKKQATPIIAVLKGPDSPQKREFLERFRKRRDAEWAAMREFDEQPRGTTERAAALTRLQAAHVAPAERRVALCEAAIRTASAEYAQAMARRSLGARLPAATRALVRNALAPARALKAAEAAFKADIDYNMAVRHDVDVLDEPGMMARRRVNDLPWFYAREDLRLGWLELICPNPDCGKHSRRRFDEFYAWASQKDKESDHVICKFCTQDSRRGHFPFGKGPHGAGYWSYLYLSASGAVCFCGGS